MIAPLLTTPVMSRSFAAAPSAMVKLRVPPPRLSLLLMLAVVAEPLVVRSPPSDSVPVLAVFTVPPVIVMLPRTVSVPVPVVTKPPPAIPVETMFRFVIVSEELLESRFQVPVEKRFTVALFAILSFRY